MCVQGKQIGKQNTIAGYGPDPNTNVLCILLFAYAYVLLHAALIEVHLLQTYRRQQCIYYCYTRPAPSLR